MIDDKELGRKLKILREFKNISRDDFADMINKKLNYVEYDNSYFTPTKIYYYEIGKRQFSAIFLKACCEILDINIQWFYEDIEKIISNNSNNLLSDSKNIMLLRLKFNHLIKILDKLSDNKVYERFLKLLENFEKE